MPMPASTSSSLRTPNSLKTRRSRRKSRLLMLVPALTKERFSSLRPKEMDSVRWRFFRECRMPLRALLDTAKESQSGLGPALLPVMISTLWPLSNCCERGARTRSMRQATQWLPMSVCTA